MIILFLYEFLSPPTTFSNGWGKINIHNDMKLDIIAPAHTAGLWDFKHTQSVNNQPDYELCSIGVGNMVRQYCSYITPYIIHTCDQVGVGHFVFKVRMMKMILILV